ncbi:ATP-binding Cassette (ABC) Superfamily, partial [Thraustotheca clavata]
MVKYQSVALNQKQFQIDKHPLEKANVFSRWTYFWANGLISLGNERQLEASDIWPLQQSSRCKIVSTKFLPKYYEKKSIIKAWISVFGCQAFTIGVMQLLAMVFSLYGPIVLQKVVTAVESTDGAIDVQSLLLSIGSLFLVKITQATIQTQSDLKNELMYVQATSALQDLLYKKAMVLNAKSRKTKSTGELSNLFTADIWWCLTVSFNANQMWIIPLQIVAMLCLLWGVLGYAMLFGIGVMLLSFVLNRIVASKLRVVWEILMEKEDARMKVVNEVFGAMQVIKLNAWEERYQEKITDLRNNELKSLWHETLLLALSSAMNNIAPVLLTTVSFGAYVLLFKQTLTAAKVFTALSLFSMIKAPMMRLPQLIANWMQAYVSYGRFCDFLALEEKTQDFVTQNVSSPNTVIEVIDGSFGYDAEKPLFSNLNWSVKLGELVVIHGAVGEGKSSLCNILLGEMDKYAGSVAVNGRIAYFAQQPWIQNMTIRENILFGLPYDRKKYNAVLEACALSKDLSLFAAG